jgi:sugar phosphate isomerase/epimerase
VPGWPADGIASCKACVKLAEAVGAGVVVVHLAARLAFIQVRWGAAHRRPFVLPYPSRAQRSYLEWLKGGLHELQATTGVIIAVENLAYSYPLAGLLKSVYYLNTPNDWARLEHWAMDTTHLGASGMDIIAVYERLKRRLAHVHLSNYNGKEHRPLDDGRLPLAELLQHLRRDGYTGIITCEMDPEPLGAADEAVVRENLRKTVEFCREHYG